MTNPGSDPLPHHELAPSRSARVPSAADWHESAGSGRAKLPPALTSAPDVVALLRALQHRWPMALGLGLVLALAATLAAFYLVPKPKYKAAVLLSVATHTPKIIFDTSENRPENKAEFRVYQATQLALIKSRLVLNAALKRPRVAELESVREQFNPVDWLEKQIITELPNNTELLVISIAGDKPQDLAILANAVADAYMEEIVTKEHHTRLVRFEELKELWNTGQERLSTKRARLKKLSESVGTLDKSTMALKQQFAIEQLAQEKKELQRVQTQLKRARVELAVLASTETTQAVAPVADAAIDEFMEKEGLIAHYKAQVADLTTKLYRVQRMVRAKNDPSVQTLRRELETIQKDLAAYRAKLRPTIAQQLRDANRNGQPDRLAELRTQIRIDSDFEKVLEEGVRRLEVESQAFNLKTLDLQAMLDEIEQGEGAVKRIGAEVEALSIEVKAPQRVNVIERAEGPRVDNANKRLMTIGLVALGAFGCTVMGVSWREYRARRVDSVDEVVHGLGMRLVGTLPALPSERSRHLAPGSRGLKEPQWQNLLVESIDAARTVLLRDFRNESLRVLMITSASKGEGKSSLASHLAISLARTGRRTLLVDFDLRSPSVHRLFDVPSEPGICELLRGEVDVAEAVRPVLGDLDVIPAGRTDAAAIRALAQDSLADLFERLKQRHDFIVVDSAPVLPVADSLLISQHVDAAIFSVSRDVSRIPAVYAGYQKLATLGVRLLGAVLTGVPVDRFGQSYSYDKSTSR